MRGRGDSGKTLSGSKVNQQRSVLHVLEPEPEPEPELVAGSKGVGGATATVQKEHEAQQQQQQQDVGAMIETLLSHVSGGSTINSSTTGSTVLLEALQQALLVDTPLLHLMGLLATEEDQADTAASTGAFPDNP